MQTIVAPLTIEDFEKDSVLVISKVKIDSDGLGDFRELPDVKTYNISINEENRTAKFCSYSFNIICLNIDDRYNPLNLDSDYYGWLKQGRKIELYAGIKKDENPLYQLILGRIDNFRLNKRAGQDICTISGRCLMRMILDFKLYYPNTYWGTDILYDTVANKIRYDMETDCEGIYKVELDYTNKDGTALEEIFENTDWTYDWHSVPNQLVFTPQRIPDFAGTNNLKVYYFQTQDVEDVVADILLEAGIFADEAAKNTWLTSEYCTATDKTIKRVRFVSGTSASKAITLLAEVVQYRFYFDYAGNPIFKPKPDIESPVNLVSDYEAKTKNIEENVEEVYTHIIVIGEERDRIIGEDEIAPAVPTGLTLSTGLGTPTQASLAWILAEWDANTESDFGHYELRIRKVGDSDYTEVSTTAISFIWYSLEPGVEYSIIIRAVDIYNNRSDWSSEVTILTATDETEPAQITGAVATALLAGIRVVWTKSMGTNIAGYIVERQESENGTTWIGEWSERVRTDSTNWMDLHLPYVVYYRYRIKAFTQTEVEGPSSSPTGDSVKPNKAGPDDIIARSITGDHIAVNTIMANNYQELRNTYVHPGQDSLDATHPFELDFEIVSEMTSIVNVKLSFRIRKFRAYSTGAASGGGVTSTYVTTPSGGGQSSTSVSHTHYGQSVWPGGTHGHGWGWQDATTTSTLGHWHHYNKFILISTGGVHSHTLDIYSSGSHSHYVYAHTHPSHAHYVYAHTHNLVFGIYEETQSPTVNVYIDNGAGYGSSIGAYTTDKLDINITGYISGTGFKRIKFTSNKKTRISAWVLCKIDLSA